MFRISSPLLKWIRSAARERIDRACCRAVHRCHTMPGARYRAVTAALAERAGGV
jgi:hypothetical protein